MKPTPSKGAGGGGGEDGRGGGGSGGGACLAPCFLRRRAARELELVLWQASCMSEPETNASLVVRELEHVLRLALCMREPEMNISPARVHVRWSPRASSLVSTCERQSCQVNPLRVMTTGYAVAGACSASKGGNLCLPCGNQKREGAIMPGRGKRRQEVELPAHQSLAMSA